MNRVLGILLAASLCIGCVTTSGQADLVAKRAVFDLNCQRSQLRISSLGNDVFGVRGCGQRAAYIVTCTTSNIGSCTAIMNNAEKPKVADSE